MAKNIEVDLWWESREKTRREYAVQRAINPFVYKVMSFAGKPARQTFAGLNFGLLGRDNAALAIDL